ncbi:MAG: hypothetical protein ACRDSR_07580 [Pseudonocardiaceae bacterium]
MLHRLKEPSRARPRTKATLGTQFERELREVGRVGGIPVDVLLGWG